MRLTIICTLFSFFLLFGCIAQPLDSASNPGDSAGDAQVDDSQTNYSDVNNGQPDRRPIWIMSPKDMAVYNNKLYIVSSAGTSSIVYQYVDDRTVPKEVMRLTVYNSTFSREDPKFKDKLFELNSLAVYNNVLYVAGAAGLFKMKDNGEWEYLDYPAPGAPAGGFFGIDKMKVFNGELYVGASYAFQSETHGGVVRTDRVLKLVGNQWQEVPGVKEDTGLPGITDIELYGATLYVGEDSAVYKHIPIGENAPRFEDLVTDTSQVDLDRFTQLGTDGSALYACGESAKVYRYSGQWQLLKEVADDCEFFKTIDGIVYFGVGSFPAEDALAVDKRGLFKIVDGQVQHVATPIETESRYQTNKIGVNSIAKYNGELIVGTTWGDRGGGLYKVKGDEMERIVFYK
ncbi:MAG: hypothetical protein V1722_05335 [Candidatus Micrarchaeota archaeon]